MSQVKSIIKRELASYLFSPISFIFLIVFLITLLGCTFALGNFYKSNNAALAIFFQFHPWIYLFLVPAIGMRLWAEEKREGTIEVLFTLPIELWKIVLGKFIASWVFILIGLFMTSPLVITVYFLGEPDFGPIFSGYMGSWFMAGAFLAITCFTSALTENQVISFVLAVIVCFLFVLLGYGVFQQYLNILPAALSDFLTNLGFITHFQKPIRGVLEFRDFIYFFSIIGFFLVLNMFVLERKRSH